MEKIYYRDFNNPTEVSLGNIKKEFGKIVQIELHFKDAGYEYNFQLHHPAKPTKYDGAGNPVLVEWDNLREELSIAQISRIDVQKKLKSTSIDFWRGDDVEIHILCKDISGLPKDSE